MADIIIKKAVVDDIADAVRSVTGGNTALSPQDFAQEVYDTELNPDISLIDDVLFINCKLSSSAFAELQKSGVGVKTGNKIVSIPAYCFKDSYIKSAELSDSITSLSTYSFQSCSKLLYVVLSKNLTFGNGTSASKEFSGCNKLEKVYVPATVTFQNRTDSNAVFIKCNAFEVYTDAESWPSGWAANAFCITSDGATPDITIHYGVTKSEFLDMVAEEYS